MSLLVDSNILIDALSPASEHYRAAQTSLIEGGGAERLFINPVVWSEVAPAAGTEEILIGFCEDMLIERRDLGWSAAFLAGQAHARYRRAGGQRERTLPDFLIGAHAQSAGLRLLTRDPARYRGYFPDLEIVTPDQFAG